MSNTISYLTVRPASRVGGFSIASRYHKLIARLGRLERLIRLEHGRPRFDPVYVQRLKKLRLRAKDTLHRISAALKAPKSRQEKTTVRSAPEDVT